MEKKLFTSESVTEGHPDKICDRISDEVLDAMLREDHDARVACETVVTTGMVMVMGEITAKANVDIASLVRETIKDIGYKDGEFGFDGENCAVLISLDKQSPDIALGVDCDNTDCEEEKIASMGAGDQGMMFGYACDETKELMPLSIALAHDLSLKLSDIRKKGLLDYLGPDGKSQVTIEYDRDRPKRVDTVVVSTQHKAHIDMDSLRDDMIEHVIKPTIPAEFLDDDTKFLINPTGRFVVGGPVGDSGLTGRKIIVDTYGGHGRHGGGAFSGKDPSKVDRSSSYGARYVAKNIVAANLAKRCEVGLAYAIGVSEPVSIMVDTFGTGIIKDEEIVAIIKDVFDLRPGAIIRDLGLKSPIYSETSAYGHFGRKEVSFPWEKTDRVDTIKEKSKEYIK